MRVDRSRRNRVRSCLSVVASGCRLIALLIGVIGVLSVAVLIFSAHLTIKVVLMVCRNIFR